MALFALTTIPGARVLRFPLSHELSVEIGAEFEGQFDAFMQDITEVITFDGRYTPDRGELLTIPNYQDVDGMVDAVASPLAVQQFDPDVHSFLAVKALFTSMPTGNGSARILIQLFETRRLVASKGLTLFFSENTFRKMVDTGLALDTKLLAVLEDATLKFQSFHFLRRALEVSEYFNEATDGDVAAFTQHEKLHVDNVEMFLGAANPTIRRKIALIKQSGVLDNFTTAQIVGTAQTFNLRIQTNVEGKIVLPINPTELRRLLRFLDEDYYESSLSQTRFLSNSKRVAD